MDDLISRQAAIDALRTCQTYLFTTYDDDKKISLESAEYMIEQLPSAQPEIIRCRDCKWYEIDKPHYCGFGGHGYRLENDFCSDAEREEKVRPYDPIWDMYLDEFEDDETES